jgi:hypothetical protein
MIVIRRIRYTIMMMMRKGRSFHDEKKNDVDEKEQS